MTHENESVSLDPTLREFASFTREQLSDMIGDDNVSIARRTRLLWYLRHVHTDAKDDDSDGIGLVKKSDVIDILANGFKSQSSLLRHEVAYVIGQLGDSAACGLLSSVLEDVNEDCMVRHEAGEALGAIGNEESIPILEKYLNDPVREVRETCEIAIANIRHHSGRKDDGSAQVQQSDKTQVDNEFQSVDPAPPVEDDIPTSELREQFLNMDLPLFERYRVMFALRNRVSRLNDLDALRALCDGFREEEGALFKHEIAFVMGQLQRHETAETLERVLRDEREHAMVRHEAAEALGSISDPKSLQVLQDFQKDSAEAVSDSCIVAVDMHEYWSEYNAPKSNE